MVPTIRSGRSPSPVSRLQLGVYWIGALWLVMGSPWLRAEAQNQEKARPTSSRDRQVRAARENDLMIVQMPIGSTARSVWRSNISLGDESEKKTREELLSLIDRINAFHFQGQAQPAAPATDPVAVPNAPALITPTETSLPPEPVKPVTKETTVESIDPNDIQVQTRQTLRTISQQPASLADPLALAELLFRADHLEQAAICYQEAFRRTTQDQADSGNDADWMLFQIGNCLRRRDPNAALVAYQQLLTQHADSPWVSMARVKSKWIDWMAEDDPRGLLAALK